MLGAPIIGIGLMMVNYLGVENHPELASTYLILANVINLILDYIFLRFTRLELRVRPFLPCLVFYLPWWFSCFISAPINGISGLCI